MSRRLHLLSVARMALLHVRRLPGSGNRSGRTAATVGEASGSRGTGSAVTGHGLSVRQTGAGLRRQAEPRPLGSSEPTRLLTWEVPTPRWAELSGRLKSRLAEPQRGI